MASMRGIGFKIQLSEDFKPQDNSVTKDMQVLKTGKFFDPRYKSFEITEKMLNELVNNFKSGVRGIVPTLDYAHETDGVAAGWFKDLYIKDGDKGRKELWAKIELTPSGQKSLSDKEYGYLSADFDESYVDNETGKKCGCVLLGAALTNRPVLKRMSPAIQLAEGKDAVSDKIAKLISEGKDPEQAQAIALEMERQGKLSEGDLCMNEEEKKKLADMEKKLADYKKLEEAYGVEGPEALMKAIADKKKEGEMGDMEKKELMDAQKELSETKAKLAELEKKAKDAEQESEFNKLLSEGKAVAAQREAFMSGDMKKFAELAQPVKLNEAGSGGGKVATGDADEEIMKEATKLLSENKGWTLKQAVAEVLKTNKSLAEKRAK